MHGSIELHFSPTLIAATLFHLDEPWAHVFLGTRSSEDKIDG